VKFYGTRADLVAMGGWIRSERRNRAFALAWGAMAAFWAFIAALLVTAIGGSDEAAALLLFAALFGAAAVAMAKAARGCAQAGLRIGADDVTVRNPWRTLSFPAGAVRGFRGGGLQRLAANPTPGVVMDLNDGSWVPVWTLGSDGFVWNARRRIEEWDRRAQALNDALREAQARP
jgi:Bacterial PH domain